MTVELIRKTKDNEGLKVIMKNAKSSGIKIGILSGTGEHPNSTSGQTLAEIAWWNEFGTSVKSGRSGGEIITIPERPFLRSTMKENKNLYFRLMKSLIQKMLLLEIKIDRAEKILGTKVQSDIRKKITSLKMPPNAPSTVEKKGSSNPLIDTGALRQHINWIRY